MKQVWIVATGGPEKLQQREAPDLQPRTGELRIRVRASGINFADILARKGLYPDAPKLPAVVGYEVSGTGDAVGPQADAAWIGKEVFALRRGSLIVIPIGKALLYAEPIYLQAANSPMPELRLVVLALQNQLAYGPTFETAMAALFQGAPSTLRAQEATGSAAPTAQAVAGRVEAQGPKAELSALIDAAAQDFADYQQLTAAGKLADAGKKLEALKRTLAKLEGSRQQQ